MWYTVNTIKHASIIEIQFNSIHIYLRANLTAQRPITKLARVRRNKNKNKNTMLTTICEPA
jgi:hypothetical protein